MGILMGFNQLLRILSSVLILAIIVPSVFGEAPNTWPIESEDGDIVLQMPSQWTKHGKSISGSCPGESCSIYGDPYVVFNFVGGIPNLDYAERMIDTGTLSKPIGIGVWSEYSSKDIKVENYNARFLFPTDGRDRWNLLLQVEKGTLVIALLHNTKTLLSNDSALEYMKQIATAFLEEQEVLSSISKLHQNTDVPTLRQEPYVPADLDSAIEHLKTTLPTSDIEFIKTASDSDIAGLHHGFGTGLRNSWGLWGGSRLAKWFNKIGIHHPDDMSGLIISSLVTDLRGEPRNFEKEVANYIKYWEEAKEFEKQEEKEKLVRKTRRDEAMLGWKWKGIDAPTVELPKRPDWNQVWGIQPFDTGFILITKKWRRSFNSTWHDGIYFLKTPNSPLQPVKVEDCQNIEDVVYLNGKTNWLCSNVMNEWSLLTTQNKKLINKKPIELTSEFQWLRLGISGKKLLLISEQRIYKQSENDWNEVYKASSPDRKYPQFDFDWRDRDESEFFFPHRGKTPIEFAGHVYFQVRKSGNESSLYRLDINRKDEDLEEVRDFFVLDYIGRYVFHVSDIAIDKDNTLWVGTSGNDHIFNISSKGKTRIGSVFGDIGIKGSIDDHKKPKDWRKRLPTGAILIKDEGMYLAGTDGIVLMRDDKVTPTVYFTYPEGVDRTPYTSSPQYSYHVRPQRLEMFQDGSFILGDMYDGVYVLIKEGSDYHFVIPTISQVPVDLLK